MNSSPKYTEKPRTCVGCPWEKLTYGYAAGSGPSTAKLAMIAESLGENEAIQGIPLVGWSGGEANKFLRSAKSSREEVYCDNVVRCKPPPTKRGQTKKIPKEVIEFCTAAHLKPALEFIKPNCIIALGDYSFKHLTDLKFTISKARGSLYYSDKYKCKVVPTYHPAFLAKGEGARVMYPFVEVDFVKGVKEARSAIYIPPAERYNISPSLTQIQDFRDKILLHKRLSIDIETSGGSWWNTAVLCVGLYASDEALCVPLLGKGGVDVWQRESLDQVVSVLYEILAEPGVTKVLQNAAYDITVLESNGFVINGPIEDTMLKHHALFPDKGVPHDLAFIGSIYSDIPYYKDDVKGAENFALLENHVLRTYNCRDVKVTYDSDIEMDSELDDYGTRKTYEMDRALLRPLIRIQRRGLMVHEGLLQKYRRLLDDELANALSTIKLVAGPELVTQDKRGRDTVTPLNLKKFLFQTLGLQSIGMTQTGQPRTDLDAMLELMDQAGTKLEPLFYSLIEYGRVKKMRSTYFDEFILDSHGRVHTQLLQHVTPTGRLSSRGPNMQNVPDGIAREIFVARPGFVFLDRDYSQIEVRIYAYLTNDNDLIICFEQGKDIHDMNVADLFSIPLGTHSRDQRDFSKNFLYGGLLYGGTAGTIRRLSMSKLLRASFRSGGFSYADAMARIPSIATIDKLQNTWLSKHPNTLRYRADIENSIRKDRKLETPLGRTRIFLGSIQDVIRAGYNFKIQGTAADIINKAMIKLDQIMPEPAGMNLQVHDSLLFEIPESELSHWLEATKKVMEEPVNINGQMVTFPTTAKIGTSWGKMESVKENS